VLSAFLQEASLTPMNDAYSLEYLLAKLCTFFPENHMLIILLHASEEHSI